MKRKRLFRILSVALVIYWMCVIFSYSSRTGDESAEESYRVGIWIGNTVVAGFHDWPVERQYAFAKSIDHPVRKAAHGAEYGILAGCCFFAFVSWKMKRNHYFYAWLLATLYACTDEFHQLFVPKRSGQIKDICIDATGALITLCILWAFIHATKKIKNRKLAM